MVAQACDLNNREAEAGKLSQVQSQNELQSWDSSYKKETKDKEKVKKGKHTHTILCVQYLGWGSTRIKEGEEGEKESKNAKLCLPFLAAASFLSFLNFSKARRMSTILLVSDCFFLTSDKTPSAAALSSCSWRGKKSTRTCIRNLLTIHYTCLEANFQRIRPSTTDHWVCISVSQAWHATLFSQGLHCLVNDTTMAALFALRKTLWNPGWWNPGRS